jgi:ABC-type cobalamin/Fe3+-siderophores transport system ATPase subunit
MIWSCEDLSFRYPGAPGPALDGVCFAVWNGTSVAALGPNGSGKSTLLRLLLGTLRPLRGTVRFRGRAIREWSRRELGKRVGVVLQAEATIFPWYGAPNRGDGPLATPGVMAAGG